MLIIDEVLLKQQDEWQPVHPETQELGGYRQPMSAREGGYPTTFSVTPSPRVFQNTTFFENQFSHTQRVHL